MAWLFCGAFTGRRFFAGNSRKGNIQVNETTLLRNEQPIETAPRDGTEIEVLDNEEW